MSVIGIDFGNENCFIAVARAGGIETIANEQSCRDTPAYVAFGDRQREFGAAAKSQHSRVYGFKHLLGRKFQDADIQSQKHHLQYRLVELADGEVGVLVNYKNEEQQFSSRQITAMLFTKLKDVAEAALKIKVCDCVISVPLYFNDCQRRALLDASKIAGLNCLKLMNETTAVALSYGFYKNDLPPATEDKGRIVAFVDLGHSAMQVCLVEFKKDRLKVLSCATDVIGGRDFDRALVEHFAEDFRTRYKLNVMESKRAIARLTTECEKIKKQMSSINLELPLNIECFMEDKDVTGKMKRDAFEEMSAPLLNRVEAVLQNAINDCPVAEGAAPITAADVDSVEIVGGSSRIPAVKALVKKVFGREPSTTLNADEAVSRGCALQCAMLSPTFKVKDFSITDVQPYPIAVRIAGGVGEPTEYTVFPKFHAAPFSRALSIYKREPFQVEAFYKEDGHPTGTRHIGSFKVDVKPTNSEASEDDKVKLKVRVNLHGIFSLMSATLIERSAEDAAKDAAADENAAAAAEPASTDAAGPAAENGAGGNDEMEIDQASSKKTKKSKLKQTEIPIDIDGAAQASDEVNALGDLEASMVIADRNEKERLDAKNAVEEYVYDMRDKLSDQLSAYAADDEKSTLSALLSQTEDWLYGEGEDLGKQAYVERLDKLHALGQPISERCREAADRPRALEQLGALLQRVRKGIAAYRAGEEQYAHLAEEDVVKLEGQLDAKQNWLDEIIGKLNNTPPTRAPPVFVSQLNEETATFDRLVNNVLNKPRPQPPKPEPAAPNAANDAPAGKDDEPMNTDDAENAANGDKPQQNGTPTENSMDVE